MTTANPMKTILTPLVIVFILVLQAAAQSPIEYFKGAWTMSVKDNEGQKMEWIVVNDPSRPGLLGEVRTNGIKTSTDHWNLYGKYIQRIAMTMNGMVVEMVSPGWKGDVLIFNGIGNDADGEFKVRETIKKRSATEFEAVWERKDRKGKWTVFSEEICKRQVPRR